MRQKQSQLPGQLRMQCPNDHMWRWARVPLQHATSQSSAPHVLVTSSHVKPAHTIPSEAQRYKRRQDREPPRVTGSWVSPGDARRGNESRVGVAFPTRSRASPRLQLQRRECVRSFQISCNHQQQSSKSINASVPNQLSINQTRRTRRAEGGRVQSWRAGAACGQRLQGTCG